MKVVLETESQFRPQTFSVDECSSPEEAEKKLNEWLDKKKELMEFAINKRLIRMAVE